MSENKEIMIRAEGLGKRYNLGQTLKMYGNFREALMSAPRALGHILSGSNNKSAAANDDSEFWALRDISFEIKRGEVVGVIGRNGAGKSTLLKLLSRITEPTRGEAFIYGRLASLLEVGTGFHPELTGRENIYLNGSILGMHKAEIDKKFDEIVEFAEVSRFIDTPVKRYSSGMYVRLAFAVAAHLEPEILVVDEVLAVGDASFQKKCLGKMGDVAQHGRTILFVSHNMSAVQSLCSRAIYLTRGQITGDGPTSDILNQYMNDQIGNINAPVADRDDRGGNGDVQYTNIKIINLDNPTAEYIQSGSRVQFIFEYKAKKAIKDVQFVVGVYNQFDERLFILDSNVNGIVYNLNEDQGTISCEIDDFPLPPGCYHINVFINQQSIVLDRLLNALTFNVEEGDFYGTGYAPKVSSKFYLKNTWSSSEESLNIPAQ